MNCKSEHTIQSETKLIHKLSLCSIIPWLEKEECQIYCTARALRYLVFKIHFTVKWHKLWNDQAKGCSVVTKGVPVSAQHSILSSTHSHAAAA
jgi:hypothetical protein